MFKISVIIPVFNGEEYLKTCLKSIAKQTIDEIEIIIVDNGSTDKTEQIISNFINEWSGTRRVLFLHEEKPGNANARNTGIDRASGEYIAFVDQDDYVKADFFRNLYSKAKEANSDVIVSGYQSVYKNGRAKRRMKLSPDEWSPYRMVAPWGKLYKRSLIEQFKMRFLNVSKGEDVFFVLNAYNNAKILTTVSEVGYKWLANSKSLSHTEHRHIDHKNSILPLFQALDSNLYPLKTIKKEYLEYFYIKTIVHEVMFCARGKSFEMVYGYYEELRKWIDSNYPDNEKNKYVGILTPKGEEIKRRVFVALFWKMKRINLIRMFLLLYTKLAK